MRVDDWKQHQVDQFGELLLHGVFTVVTGKSDVEKEVRTPRVPLNDVTFPSSPKVDDLGSTSQRNSSTRSIYRRATKSKFARLSARFDEFVQKLRPSKKLISETEAKTPELDNQWLEGHCFNFLCGINRSTGQSFLAEDYADIMGFDCPIYEQYAIYLFERILLCCKEVNPNKKQKDKLKLDKKAPDKRATTNGYKGTRLQLKGRIFMTNVTDVISLVKPGA